MKRLIFFLFLLPGLAQGQTPVDIIYDYVWSASDTSWLEVKKTLFAVEGREDLFNVRWDTTYLGDTATVQNALLRTSSEAQLQLARSYRLTIFSNQVDKLYNDSKTVYELITGEKWEKGNADQYGQFVGRYRVISDTSNFFANVVVLQNGANAGRLRMEREDNNDQWLFNPKSQESFQLQGARSYWQSGGTGSIEFCWDFQDRQRRVYRPRDRSLAGNGNLPTALRIIKLQ